MALAHPVDQRLAQLRAVLEVEGRDLPRAACAGRPRACPPRRAASPRTAEVATASGNGIGGSRTGWSRRQKVSPVWVSLSLATEPMSPARSRSTSIRSLPCWMERWFSFSATSCSAFQTSPPLRELAGVEPEEGDVAHVRLGHGLEDPADQRRAPPAAVHLGRRREQLDHLLEQRAERRRSARRCRRRAGRSRPASIAFLTAPMNCSRGISSPAQVALDQLVVGGGHRLGQLLGVLLDSAPGTRAGSAPPRTRRSWCPSCRSGSGRRTG